LTFEILSAIITASILERMCKHAVLTLGVVLASLQGGAFLFKAL